MRAGPVTVRLALDRAQGCHPSAHQATEALAVLYEGRELFSASPETFTWLQRMGKLRPSQDMGCLCVWG